MLGWEVAGGAGRWRGNGVKWAPSHSENHAKCLFYAREAAWCTLKPSRDDMVARLSELCGQANR